MNGRDGNVDKLLVFAFKHLVVLVFYPEVKVCE
jgi:hypothetical protein